MKIGTYLIVGTLTLTGAARADHSVDVTRTFANGASVSRHIEGAPLVGRRYGLRPLRAPWFASNVSVNRAPGYYGASWTGPYGGQHTVQRQLVPGVGVAVSRTGPFGGGYTRMRYF